MAMEIVRGRGLAMDDELIEPGLEVLPAPQAERPAAFGDALIMICLFLGSQVGIALCIGIVLQIFSAKLAAIHIAVVEAGAFVVSVLAMRRRLRCRLSAFFPIGKVRVSFFISAFLGSAGLLLFLIPAGELLAKVLPIPDLFRRVFTLIGGPAGYTGSLLLAAFVAPITEEVLFRGIVLRGLLHHHGPAIALLLSALLFGFVHLNPWQFVSGFFLGSFIGFAYIRTVSILPGLMCHALYNGGLVTLGRALNLGGLSSGNRYVLLFVGFFAFLGLVFIWLAVWILIKGTRTKIESIHLRTME
jgi:uncharacterized protein